MRINPIRQPIVPHAARSGSRLRPVRSSRGAESDPRWPEITRILAELREAGRRSLRIVDADCGTGALLVRVAQHARSLGFTAVEARGIDGAPALTVSAQAAAARARDPGIGFRFESADLVDALEEEAAFPADIVLWHGRPAALKDAKVLAALQGAGAHLCVEAHACASKHQQ